ncbi:MAG: hypothetical protein IT377_14030 [Polyangiaceae bacterium]|nr:hypothetical protein [Polyangiaceae bacterium]
MLVIGVDCSTTAAKAVVWDASGAAVCQGRSAFTLDSPGAGAWEQDAEAWWNATRLAIAECVHALGSRSTQIRALCLTHQRETFVLTDASSKPLHPALVWMDSRGVEQVERARERVGAARLRQISGKPPCITPSLYKLMALFARRPDLEAVRPRVLDVHAFLCWRLTGRFATSLASADPLGLVDMARRTWSGELCALAGLDETQLPELVEPGTELGQLDPSVAATLGLRPGLPVIAGAGDGQAAGLGAGIARSGRAYLNLGTAIVSGVASSTYAVSDAFRTLYAAAPGTFFFETDLKGGTFTLNWLAERLLGAGDPARKLAELEREAATLPAGAEGLLVVPYWNGVMNPYWDDSATGVLLGLTGRHGPAHVHRAVLEGIALEQRLHTSGVEAATGTPITEMVVMGGGATSALWCQITSDVLERPIVRARTTEASALGAGILAAIGGRLYADLPAAVAGMTATGDRFVPGPDQARYDALYSIYTQIFPALRAPMAALAAL